MFAFESLYAKNILVFAKSLAKFGYLCFEIHGGSAKREIGYLFDMFLKIWMWKLLRDVVIKKHILSSKKKLLLKEISSSKDQKIQDKNSLYLWKLSRIHTIWDV